MLHQMISSWFSSQILQTNQTKPNQTKLNQTKPKKKFMKRTLGIIEQRKPNGVTEKKRKNKHLTLT